MTGWDVEDEVITEEDLIEAEKNSSQLMVEKTKEGNVTCTRVKKKVRVTHN